MIQEKNVLMTEDEARKKWCPMYRIADHNNRPERWDPNDRCLKVGSLSTDCCCIASACAAWRAVEESMNMPAGEYRPAGDGWKKDGEPYQYHPRHPHSIVQRWIRIVGYCGLAGRLR